MRTRTAGQPVHRIQIEEPTRECERRGAELGIGIGGFGEGRFRVSSSVHDAMTWREEVRCPFCLVIEEEEQVVSFLSCKWFLLLPPPLSFSFMGMRCFLLR